MKKISLILLLILSVSLFSLANSESIKKSSKNDISVDDLTLIERKEAILDMITDEDCSWNEITLFGKVQIVDAFPDIKVQIVDAFPDIKVKWVDAFPNECGKWQKVDAFPDFKIQIVDVFPDLKIQEVDAFPGMNE